MEPKPQLFAFNFTEETATIKLEGQYDSEQETWSSGARGPVAGGVTDTSTYTAWDNSTGTATGTSTSTNTTSKTVYPTPDGDPDNDGDGDHDDDGDNSGGGDSDSDSDYC